MTIVASAHKITHEQTVPTLLRNDQLFVIRMLNIQGWHGLCTEPRTKLAMQGLALILAGTRGVSRLD